jgi:hypothetical protein
LALAVLAEITQPTDQMARLHHSSVQPMAVVAVEWVGFKARLAVPLAEVPWAQALQALAAKVRRAEQVQVSPATMLAAAVVLAVLAVMAQGHRAQTVAQQALTVTREVQSVIRAAVVAAVQLQVARAELTLATDQLAQFPQVQLPTVAVVAEEINRRQMLAVLEVQAR